MRHSAVVEGIHGEALQAGDLDGLLVVAVHDAGAFAENVDGAGTEQLAPRMLASRMVRAEPARFPLAIFLMKAGTSMCVGQAPVHGASKQ